MISFLHYGASNDISGVTTWLCTFIIYLKGKKLDSAIRLHHFGDTPKSASLYNALVSLGYSVSTRLMPATSEESFIDTLKFLNRTNPNVFLPQCLPAPHFAANYAGKMGLPWVLTLHSDDPEYWALAEQTGPSAKDGTWVAVSEHIAEQARLQFPHADIRVIPYGVPVSNQSTRWNVERFQVVFSGRLVEQQKRISLVLQTLCLACQQKPEIEALIIGDGPEKIILMRKVQELGLSKQIRFSGRLSPEQVQDKLLQAQAILLMSDYEGLPVALLEAMAAGVVPVVRDIRSGIPEIVSHGETGVITSDEASDAAAALILLSQHQETWERLSNSARTKIVTNFSQEHCFQKWQSLLDELASRSKVVYPLSLPKKIQLPPVDPRLAHVDQRNPGWLKTIWRRIRRLRCKAIQVIQ
jgi:colanic acid/amylovoran biosynthesis glycosyltransferase